MTEEEVSQIWLRILSSFKLPAIDQAQIYIDQASLIKKHTPIEELNQKVTKFIETLYQSPYQQIEKILALEIIKNYHIDKNILTEALLSFSESCSVKEMEMIWNFHKNRDKDLTLESRCALLKKYLGKGLADLALLDNLKPGVFEFSNYYDQLSNTQSIAPSLLFENALICLKLGRKIDLSFRELMIFKNKYLNSDENLEWMTLWLEKTEGKDIELCLTMFKVLKLTSNDIKPTFSLLKAIEKGISNGVNNPKLFLQLMELLKNMKSCEYTQEQKKNYKESLIKVLEKLVPLACLEAKKTKDTALTLAIFECHKAHQYLLFKEGKDHLYLEVLKCLPILIADASFYHEWKQFLLTDLFEAGPRLVKYNSNSLFFTKKTFCLQELTKAFLEIDLFYKGDEVLKEALKEIESLFSSLIDNIFKENEIDEDEKSDSISFKASFKTSSPL